MFIERELIIGANTFVWDGQENFLVQDILNTNGGATINQIIGVGKATVYINGNYQGTLTTLQSGQEYTFFSTANFTWQYPANIENQEGEIEDETVVTPVVEPPVIPTDEFEDAYLVLETTTTIAIQTQPTNDFLLSLHFENGFITLADYEYLGQLNTANTFQLYNTGTLLNPAEGEMYTSFFLVWKFSYNPPQNYIDAFQIFEDMSVFSFVGPDPISPSFNIEQPGGENHYIQIFNNEGDYEFIRIRNISDLGTNSYYYLFDVERGALNTTPMAHTAGQIVRIYSEVPEFMQIQQEIEDQNTQDEQLPAPIQTIESEVELQNFGPEGITIQQTLFRSQDIYSAINITSVDDFQNTEQSLNDLNQDDRIPLGLFFFKEDNLFSQEFNLQINDDKFKQIEQVNLLRNGNCKYTEKTYLRDSSMLLFCYK